MNSTSDPISISYKIDKVVEKFSITEYLATLGIQPMSHVGNRYRYSCPFPDHNDSDPSFYVLAEPGKIERGRCFGCNRGGSVVSVAAQMEGKSFKQALSDLSKGMDLSIEGSLGFVTKQLQADDLAFSEIENPDSFVFLINRMCYHFLESINFCQPQLRRVEKVFEMVDACSSRMDFDRLESIYEMLPDFLIAERVKMDKEVEETIAVYSQIG